MVAPMDVFALHAVCSWVNPITPSLSLWLIALRLGRGWTSVLGNMEGYQDD